MFKKILRGEGFTLIELLAVMAIVAVLAGIIAVAVSGSGETSRDTQTVQDGTSIETAAANFFGFQTNTTTNTQTYTNDLVLGVTITTTGAETTSALFPEAFITDTYSVEFKVGALVDPGVRGLILLDDDGVESTDFTFTDLLEQYTAISFTLLDLNNFITTVPDSVTAVSETNLTTGTDFQFHNFLWLFKKNTESGSTGDVDSRNITIYKLIKIDVSTTTAELTYQRIFGD